MSTDTLIRRALDAGIELQFVDGRLKVTGKRAAIAAWTPTLREHREHLLEALKPPPSPTPAVDWRPLARAYHQHHFCCATCIAAGKGYGLRCGAGTALWTAYTAAAQN
ncbi:hypothetical protein [uncultured Comamonas sp.]|uniref:hypothetical protein n=1 Tax=uncultured Comamonas sp. TaxID=114710 RepID=UPI00260A7C32|nr:hypothetical protein [uncultured Comamonas sp.]